MERIFQLEKDLVFEIINQMGISLTQEERDAIEIIPTENLLAFMAYCRGLDYEDRGLYNRAVEEYRTAVNLDPQFFPASVNLKRSESLSFEHIGIRQLVSQYNAVSSGQAPPAQSQAAVGATTGTGEEQDSDQKTDGEKADVSVEASGVITEGTVEVETGTDTEVSGEEEPADVEDTQESEEELADSSEDGVSGETESSSESQTQPVSGTQVTSQSSSVVSRMVQTGSVLSQGFLPGLDSRKPNQEQSQSSFGNVANIKVTAPLPPQ
jgi:hypothetical protein